MLDIILSNPFVVTKREGEKALGSGLTFENLLRLVGENPDTWLFDLGVKIERLLGRGARVEYWWGPSKSRLNLKISIAPDDVKFMVNDGYRIQVDGIVAIDPKGYVHNIEAYCMYGELQFVTAYELDKEEIDMNTPVFTPRNSGRYPNYMVVKPGLNVPLDVQTFGDPVNTVKCTFPDMKSTTATCKEGDTFSLEVGIGLCIAKHQLGNSFLRTIRKAKKVYEEGQKAAERRAKNQEELKALEERKKAKAEKRREQRREKRIEEQAEAIVRAALYLESLDDEGEDEGIDIPEKPELTDELVQKMREKNND